MWRKGLGAVLVVAGVVSMTLSPAPPPVATAAVIEDKTYTVTPATMKVKAGLLAGEVTEMKVRERVEQSTGRLASPAKLTARLVLKNSSANQTVRLVGGKIQYIDVHGQLCNLEDTRTEPTLKFSGDERLDPGAGSYRVAGRQLPREGEELCGAAESLLEPETPGRVAQRGLRPACRLPSAGLRPGGLPPHLTSPR